MPSIRIPVLLLAGLADWTATVEMSSSSSVSVDVVVVASMEMGRVLKQGDGRGGRGEMITGGVCSVVDGLYAVNDEDAGEVMLM
jgi:hypothetical protein